MSCKTLSYDAMRSRCTLCFIISAKTACFSDFLSRALRSDCSERLFRRISSYKSTLNKVAHSGLTARANRMLRLSKCSASSFRPHCLAILAPSSKSGANSLPASIMITVPCSARANARQQRLAEIMSRRLSHRNTKHSTSRGRDSIEKEWEMGKRRASNLIK